MEHKDYEWEVQYAREGPKKDISQWNSRFGPKVISRNEDGSAKEVEFSILKDNTKTTVYIIGDFNAWNKDEKYKLETDEHHLFASIKLTNEINHKGKYKFILEEEGKDDLMLQDAAGVYFDDEGNSIFWDYEDKDCYKQHYSFIDTTQRSVKIMQTDLPGLLSHFKDKNGRKGSDVKESEYYTFIRESGVVEKIKELGFNTIQFLPFAQSIDGSNWKFRYLVPYQYAIQKNWGNPDEFAMMIDEFHKHGIAVIGDFVLGHLPHKDYNIFGQSCEHHGLHLWKKNNGYPLYLKEETNWGTMRVDFDFDLVREYFIGSVLHFMKYYKIDGFRIDNVDGIIRYGDNGEGDEREHGRVFLRELNSAIYDYNPKALIHYEAHYYYEDNAKMLVAPIESSNRALGASAYNSSRMTYYFHTEYMFKAGFEITVWKFRYIAEEKEWGKSNSTVADFHNHDAAAGLMEMRCTGSYAYDAMIRGSDKFHVIGKLKVMEALISFICEGRTLDLLQTFLFQKGTFEHDSSIRWELEESKPNLVHYKKDINKVMDNDAFWPLYVNNRKFLNVDDDSKVLVIERQGSKSKFIIVINLGSTTLYNYKVGLTSKNDFKIIFNSDIKEYLSNGISLYPEIMKNNESKNFELLDREIELGILTAYQVLVLEEIE